MATFEHPGAALDGLPAARSVVAVCAHPDDEAFGLGAVLAAFVAAGARTTVVCLTRGEASTLGATADLDRVRAAELEAAAAALGVGAVVLSDHPDGQLAVEPLEVLAAEVSAAAVAAGADLLLGFAPDGVTGHPDHARATEAALAAADRFGLPLLVWTLEASVAAALNVELATGFSGTGDPDFRVPVDRGDQLRAIACHASQATDNAVLRRRLELQGDVEVLCWLRRPGAGRR
ncbi:MAG: PIG-L family deacetylase [Actinomycetota bacterium]|jgi:LmbE family N-acetylglucosaminyl deacetylase|nr:PIG-L family deacetylase [Actinomycetota bacterium]MDA8293373.1 PIG-L family deacetylase [Actinomycetota bacterium]